MIDIGYLGEALPETTANSLLLCHAMSGCVTTSGFFGFGKTRLFKSKMPTSTAEFYCRQQTVDRIVEAGTNIMIADTSLLTLDKLRHKLFLSSLALSTSREVLYKKGRSQTAPFNFLGCEVSLPPGVSSNTGVAVQSSRSI